MISRTTLFAGVALGALLAAPVLADEPAGDASAKASTGAAAAADDGGLPDNVIIITARRRDEQAQEVPLAIGVLDQRAINDTGASSIYKIQTLAPSLQIYSQNPRNTSVNIRGIGLPFGLTNDGVDPAVGIYVDDVYYARPASAVFDFLDVHQIEVLRGPQGTLYGKNTTAGAINIRTNQPTFDFEGNAELSLGDYDFKQFKGAISGPLSDTIAARIAVTGSNRRGTIYNTATDTWENEQDNLGVRGQLLFRPSDDLNITLSGDFSAQSPECCATVYVGYGPTQKAASSQYPALAALFPGYSATVNPDPFARETNLDAPLNAGNKTGGASLRAVWNLDDHNTFTSITAWRFWDWKPENDRDYTGLDIVSKSQNPSQQDQYSQEFRWSYDSRKIDFTLGAFGFYQRVDIQGTEQQGSDSAKWNKNTAPNLDGLTAYNTQYLKNTSFALFGQLSYHLTDRLTLQPGVRLNYDKKEGLYDRTVFDGAGNEVPASGGTSAISPADAASLRKIYAPQHYEPEFSAWNFSYDFTASYQLADDVLLYGTYARNFRTGAINNNGVPSDSSGNPILALATIKPEKVNHFEGGLKTQFWGRQITFNLSAFRTTIDNFQTSVVATGSGLPRNAYIANAQQARTQGVEVDFSIRPSERFNAYFNGAYTDATFTKFTNAPPPPELSGGTALGIDGDGNIIGTPSAPGTPGGFSPPFVDISGSVLPGVSKWSFSYGAEGNVPAKLFGKEGEIYLGVDGNYRSKFSSNPTPSIYTWVDGYNLTNFRLGFRAADGFNVYGWVRNAFDAHYYDQLVLGPSNTGLIAGFLGDPRTWGGTVRVEF
ncbi:MAG: TonB-dependent receptor [Novosphingobium sp.]|nr:TonB-dependent receptor [Novosphingobium sp.]MBO9600998.1 TonB-dependent receptor [Novosphingobium sp.]